MTKAADRAPCESAVPVLDLAHLDRQTMGDVALREEVLGLLSAQAERIGGLLDTAGAGERAALAHTLKGAARGVGAFALAAAAERLEADPEGGGHVDLLHERIREAGAAIAAALAA